MKRLLLGALFLIVASSAVAQQTYPIANNPDVVRYFGTGANDNDVLFTTSGSVRFDHCMLMSTTGAVDVFATIDGTNWSTTSLSLQDLGATTTDPVKLTAALRMYAVAGKYLALRVLQNGATGAAASLLCWKR